MGIPGVVPLGSGWGTTEEVPEASEDQKKEAAGDVFGEEIDFSIFGLLFPIFIKIKTKIMVCSFLKWQIFKRSKIYRTAWKILRAIDFSRVG